MKTLWISLWIQNQAGRLSHGHMDFISEEISRLCDAGLKRELKEIEGPQGPIVRLNGREVVLLCSNDYLGLANDPRIKKAAIEGIEKWGFGAGASRLVSGSMEAHRLLEERLARFKGTEAALVFNSGYHANLGCITAIADRSTEVFSDRLNHASIVDGCVLSRAKVTRYGHRDTASLERLLKKSTAGRKLVVTDGVFSMDGDIAPLREVFRLAEKYGAMLMVDDAHGTGVLGASGRGTLERLGVDSPDIIQMGTLGKAMGSFGAYIAGSRELIEFLISKARPFIFTTALPPAVCAASIEAINIIEGEPGLRESLLSNAKYLRGALANCGFDTLGSETQIIPVLVGEARRTMDISARLLDKGVFIQGIRPPTVPEGTSRLRITVSAAHSREDLDTALSAIKEAFDE